MDFFLVVKIPRENNAQWIVFLILILFTWHSRHDFKEFRHIIISVSFFDFGIELYTWHFLKFLRSHKFVWRYFQVGGLAPASEDVIYDYLWLCLFTAAGLSSYITLLETTGNLETSAFLRWLWICFCVVFIWLCLLDSVSHPTDIEEKLPKYS